MHGGWEGGLVMLSGLCIPVAPHIAETPHVQSDLAIPPLLSVCQLGVTTIALKAAEEERQDGILAQDLALQ